MKAVDLVVFDIIGTTVKTSDAVPEAFMRALMAAGRELSDEDIASVRGKSKRAAIAELLGRSHDADAVYEAFRGFLADSYRANAASPIEGVTDTFDWCRDNNVDIALTTGFDRDLAMLLIDQLDWHERIDTIVCNDEVESGRPSPDLILTAMRRLNHIDVARVASVGDTISDLAAGTNAGTGWNIGVLSGAHSREQLMAVPHTALINSVADLPALLS